MKRGKKMRKVFLLTGILAVSVLGISANSKEASNQEPPKKEVATTVKKAENTPEATALNFINTYYINLRKGVNDSKWFEAQPLTNNFKKIYKNQEKAIEISNRILEGKKVSKADRAFAEKYSVDYTAIFGALVADLQDDSVFELESYNQKTGIVNLKDKKTGIEMPVKVIKVNGKWLIDGAGLTNMPNKK
jgi:hypothetical protein